MVIRAAMVNGYESIAKGADLPVLIMLWIALCAFSWYAVSRTLHMWSEGIAWFIFDWRRSYGGEIDVTREEAPLTFVALVMLNVALTCLAVFSAIGTSIVVTIVLWKRAM